MTIYFDAEIDRLKIEVLVDNHCDALSSVPVAVSSEFARLLGRADPLLSGRNICCAGHGLSLLLTASSGGKEQQLLFDAGPDADLFARNLQALGINIGGVEDIVLSHGHWDHAGGMLMAMEKICANRPTPYNIHVNEGMFVERGVRIGDQVLPFAAIPSVEDFQAAGANVVSNPNERVIGQGLFYLSGEIPRVSEFEEGYVGHVKKNALTGIWQDDALIMDERYLAVRIKGRGLFVFSACSHAGSINVLSDLKRRFPDDKLYGLMGGLHLSGLAMELKIAPTISAMKDLGIDLIIPAHCTGWRAVNEISKVFSKEQIIYCSVGQNIELY